jgi:hypothetical protein
MVDFKHSVIIFWLISAPALAAIYGGNPSNSGGNTPVVQSTTLSGSSPAVLNALVGNVGATNSPTSCTITAGDSSGNFSCTVSGGNLQIKTTATGVSNLAANDTSAVVTQNLTVQATNSSGSGSASVIVNVYADGSTNAPTVAAGAQLPTILNSYAVRPPWKIAGVDYPVGIPDGVSFKDPTTATLPSGCGYNGAEKLVGCSSQATITGYDFCNTASGEVGLYYTGATGTTLTVTNSNFCGGGNKIQPIQSASNAGNIVVTYSKYTGSGTDGNPFVYSIGCNTTLKYVWMLNAGADDVDTADSCASGVHLREFNLYENDGQAVGTHPDWEQEGTSGSPTYTIIYNTSYMTTVGTASQGYLMTSAATTWTMEIGRNTMVAPGAGTMSYMLGHMNGTFSSSTIHDNYADIFGTLGSFWYGGSISAAGFSVSGMTVGTNTNMRNGSSL